MGGIIEWVLEMRIRPGATGTYPALIAEMAEATQANEPGALVYEYFLTADGTGITVVERYVDSDAALVHLDTFGKRFAERFLAVFEPVRLTVYGPASEALRAALVPLGAAHLERVEGFSR
ncbi:putative quinol monooxygenase [Frigidibacter sp. MR17.24]|uniref:putative quinol monooxygenase n=1 Tax=Frigidibacter sp. MR17.24 TaxID=3127345 RepID=UPI003012B540